MQDFKATKVKKKNSLKAKSSNTSSPYLLLLADPFAFNFSFSILPNIISNNIPVPFL